MSLFAPASMCLLVWLIMTSCLWGMLAYLYVRVCAVASACLCVCGCLLVGLCVSGCLLVCVCGVVLVCVLCACVFGCAVC